MDDDSSEEEEDEPELSSSSSSVSSSSVSSTSEEEEEEVQDAQFSASEGEQEAAEEDSEGTDAAAITTAQLSCVPCSHRAVHACVRSHFTRAGVVTLPRAPQHTTCLQTRTIWTMLA